MYTQDTWPRTGPTNMHRACAQAQGLCTHTWGPCTCAGIMHMHKVQPMDCHRVQAEMKLDDHSFIQCILNLPHTSRLLAQVHTLAPELSCFSPSHSIHGKVPFQ